MQSNSLLQCIRENSYMEMGQISDCWNIIDMLEAFLQGSNWNGEKTQKGCPTRVNNMVNGVR